jgi:hypothetical protein
MEAEKHKLKSCLDTCLPSRTFVALQVSKASGRPKVIKGGSSSDDCAQIVLAQ